MTYEPIKNLGEEEFKRLCGVKPKLFQEMVAGLKPELPKLKQRGGQTKLSTEDQLLIAQSWGVHESTVGRTVHRVEDQLIKSRKFSLPGKKALSSAEAQWSVVIVDVGESREA